MRKYYIDNIRYFTVIIVVFFHVIYMYNGESIPGVVGAFHENQIQDIFQYIVYPWIMILLFIISGISSNLYLKKYNNFLYDRTIKLLVPSTLGILAFGWTQGYYNMKLSQADLKLPNDMNKFLYFLIMCISGTGVLWFNQVLWINSFILSLVMKFNKTKLYIFLSNIEMNLFSILFLGLGLLFSAQILNTPIIVVYRFGVYGYSFFIGYFIFSNEQNIKYLELNYIYLLIISLIFGVLYINKYNGMNYALKEIFGSTLSIGYAWFSCLAIIGIGKKHFNSEYKFTIFMRKKSYGIYVFHYLFLSSSAYYLNKYSNFYPFIQYIIVSFSSFIGSIILFDVMEKIPYIRWCVLGIDYSIKKNKNI